MSLSVSAGGEEGGVGRNEERHLCFTLSSPQSHIKALKAVMNPHLAYLCAPRLQRSQEASHLGSCFLS